MEFKQFQKKLVAVLNRKIEHGRVMNALAHMSLGLAGSVAQTNALIDLRLQDYTDNDKSIHPKISDIPFIILEGNSSQIRNLRKAAIEHSLNYTDFTNTMIGETYVEQHANTNKAKEQDLEYFGICLFGDWDLVSQLTKKFSLWK